MGFPLSVNIGGPRLWMKVSISPWDDPGTPNRPTGGVFYSNWPNPARVKGVYLQYSGFNIICQNPDVKLVVEMMVEPIRQSCQCILTCTCPHKCFDLWLGSLARYSCLGPFCWTQRLDNCFFLEGLTTPSFNSSSMCYWTASLWASGILNCLT